MKEKATWRGKHLEDMTKDELIAALKAVAGSLRKATGLEASLEWAREQERTAKRELR